MQIVLWKCLIVINNVKKLTFFCILLYPRGTSSNNNTFFIKSFSFRFFGYSSYLSYYISWWVIGSFIYSFYSRYYLYIVFWNLSYSYLSFGFLKIIYSFIGLITHPVYFFSNFYIASSFSYCYFYLVSATNSSKISLKISFLLSCKSSPEYFTISYFLSRSL